MFYTNENVFHVVFSATGNYLIDFIQTVLVVATVNKYILIHDNRKSAEFFWMQTIKQM